MATLNHIFLSWQTDDGKKINQNNHNSAFFISLVFAVAIAKILASFFKPVVLSFLISFLFIPLIKRLNIKCRIPWTLAILIVYVIFFGIFIGLSNILAASIESILKAIPEYNTRFISIYNKLSQALDANSKILFFFDLNTDKSLIQNLFEQLNIFSALKQVAINFTGGFFTFTKTLFLVILLSFFLLTEMHFTRRKINTAFEGNNLKRVHKIVNNVISEITHFITIKFIISLATGIVITLACCAIKMDFPLVWGFFAFAMNFIPTFGSIISCVITIMFSILQFYPSPLPIVVISLILVTTNFALGNIIEPKIEGENLGLSPFIILLSLSFWGWLWGILGMLIAVPLMVIVKIFCENISFLNPIAIFIGGNPKDKQSSKESNA
ncbi:AI-2E family transporter [Treponema zioleckii]|uniref:AI-2E family transporter n=1 Tax=Treponema zioleckii TaxID=331680 RepID=UPI001F5BDBF3|nr:AI-2E family transporter [Treponema zioleckii]